MSVEDHLRAAFAALLKGDLAERDRQCDLARALIADIRQAETHPTIPLIRGADGTYRPARRP